MQAYGAAGPRGGGAEPGGDTRDRGPAAVRERARTWTLAGGRGPAGCAGGAGWGVGRGPPGLGRSAVDQAAVPDAGIPPRPSGGGGIAQPRRIRIRGVCGPRGDAAGCRSPTPRARDAPDDPGPAAPGRCGGVTAPARRSSGGSVWRRGCPCGTAARWAGPVSGARRAPRTGGGCGERRPAAGRCGGRVRAARADASEGWFPLPCLPSLVLAEVVRRCCRGPLSRTRIPARQTPPGPRHGRARRECGGPDRRAWNATRKASTAGRDKH
jgi:hypothetical protein